ncbi:MAG: cation-translocating P-type ATPase [Acidimicrobiales bacterium]
MRWWRAAAQDVAPATESEAALERAWSLAVSDVVDSLAVDTVDGLSNQEAARRLALYGSNELPSGPTISAWRRFARHLRGPIAYLLVGAIVISTLAWAIEGADGAPVDAIVIALILTANATIGFLQERRAADAVAALQAMTTTAAVVVRGGDSTSVLADEVVPGDVVLLAEGDLVPADARIVEASVLRVAEATLTGESAPVAKTIPAVAIDAPLGDRSSVVHSGTAVVSGRGRAVVTATGSQTEVGRIASLLGEIKSEPTPLQDEVDRVGRVLGIVVVFIAIIVIATLLILDRPGGVRDLVDASLIGVSLAVAAVPEGLPAVLSVVLALGVQRMATRNALVKRLASVETLGSATVICSDKTGTLTRNEMTARRLVVPSGEIEISGVGYGPAGTLLLDGAQAPEGGVVHEEYRWALTIAGLTSDASVIRRDGEFLALGDPTEAALVAVLPKAGLESASLAERFTRIAELPFSAERRRLTTIHRDVSDGAHLLMVKGAPDVLLDRCSYERTGGELVSLSGARRRYWLDVIDELAGDAFRTLAVAYRPIRSDEHLDERSEVGLVLAGVFGIIDPPRDEARRAIALAQHAGIRVVMITGDHPKTASTIATELGILRAGDSVVTSPELDAATDGELAALAVSTSVYARVSPEHKLRIVNALSGAGEIVAMTGDGVNDAPALKAADIGVAMGRTGSEVSKEAADLILADDNFATIVAAVREGRAIFHNIRSSLRYLLSSNVGEVLTVFGGVIAAGWIGLAEASNGGLASPLLAVQILWINLVTDAAPALALGVDPPPPQLMDGSPRQPDERIIDSRMQRGIGLIGLTMAVVTLAVLDFRLPDGIFDGDDGLVEARTSGFTVLVLAQLFNAFNARSQTEPAWRRLTANRWLLIAVGISLSLQVAVVHVPFLQGPFGTSALGWGDWALAVGLASAVVWVSEVRKFVLRRRIRRSQDDGPRLQ